MAQLEGVLPGDSSGQTANAKTGQEDGHRELLIGEQSNFRGQRKDAADLTDDTRTVDYRVTRLYPTFTATIDHHHIVNWRRPGRPDFCSEGGAGERLLKGEQPP